MHQHCTSNSVTASPKALQAHDVANRSLPKPTPRRAAATRRCARSRGGAGVLDRCATFDGPLELDRVHETEINEFYQDDVLHSLRATGPELAASRAGG